MPAIIIVGTQWGDEGKGKFVDFLSASAQFVVRAQGGNNAGHNVVIGETEFRLHHIPAGIIYPHTQCCMGAGMVINPKELLQEIEELLSRNISVKGRLFISPRAHVIFPYHQLLDRLQETQKGANAIGTTGKGIGPCYSDSVSRRGIRMEELTRSELLYDRLQRAIPIVNQMIETPVSLDHLYEEYRCYGQELKPYLDDIEERIFEAMKQNKTVLFEGSQGTHLDLLFGTYPYVTASSTLASGILAGAGVGPTQIDHTLGLAKAYTTRVGSGPFPTELKEDELKLFPSQQEAREIGVTTGRARRMGWFDCVVVKQAVRINGITSLAITKLDILDGLKKIKICTGYRLHGRVLFIPPAAIEDFDLLEPIYEEMEGWQTLTSSVRKFSDLPPLAQKYIKRIEEILSVKVNYISVGPKRDQTLILNPLIPCL